MKKQFVLFNLFLFLSINLFAQTFDGEWSAEYVTPDDQFIPNSIGTRTISVGVIEENSFVALAAHFGNESYYLAGYRNASHLTGLLGTYEYGSIGKQTKWINLFDQVFLEAPKDLATHGNIIYVANNDADHNILAFELKEDSIYTYPQRYKTGDREIWAIDIDEAGHIFVTIAGDSTNPGSVLIFDDPTSSGWNSGGSDGTLLHEIILPDAGTARGVTANSDGTIVYVSNFLTRDIYCYIGDPITGYHLYNGFNFDGNTTFDTGQSILEVGPWGLNYMSTKNLLFVGHDASFVRDDGYNYGRVYVINPNSGVILDTIDIAEWNIAQSGMYNNPDSLGTSAGYAAVYNIDFDENYNMYSASYYGWSVEKWLYSEELPVVDITITDVEIIDNSIPDRFTLEQNYPNPFNPTTTIEFSITESSDVTLSIYSITGELVTKLIDGENYNSGTYKISLDASLLTSGTYFYSLRNGNKTISKKMTLLK